MDDALRKLAQSVKVIRGLHRGMGGRDAPHEPQKEKFNLPKIKPSTDNPHEVGEANFEHYDIAGHSLVPISSLSGGVNLNHPDQRRRVDALKQKISHPTEGYINRILADDEGNVLEGQHRLEALRELGATHIPITTIHNKARHIDMPALHNAIRGQGGIMSDHVGQIARMAIDSAHESGTPTKAREEWEAPHGFEDRWHSALNELERQHKITKSEGGDVEGFKKGGSPEFDKIREALARTVSPFSDNPEHVKEALRIAGTLKVPQGTKAGTGSFYNLVSPHAVADVKSTVTDIPNVTHHDPRQMTWEDLHREGKGGSFINVAGDRTNFGRLTHINDKELAWPVDLHAGPKYMLEPNKGEVWANNPTHATGFYNKIMEAGKKGPVYGIYAPMGAQSGDFAHHMFDALMAQVPNSGLTKEGAEAFNKIVKAGLHRPEKDRAKARELMKNWPGIENSKEASEFARNLPGSHRAGMVKQLDSKFMRDMGMPDVGVTRVAITDPAMRDVAGNMLGHRVVRFDPSRMGPPDRSFAHTSYPSATFGEYVGDLPLVQRHYAAPDVTEKQLAKRAGKGKNVIIHPYSMDATGRGTYRKAFEEQKQIQPINERMLESVQQGMENQKLYGLKRGGRTAYKKGGKVEGSIWHDRDVFGFGGDTESAGSAPERGGSGTVAAEHEAAPEEHEQRQSDPEGREHPSSEAEKLANQGTFPSWAGLHSGENEAAVNKSAADVAASRLAQAEHMSVLNNGVTNAQATAAEAPTSAASAANAAMSAAFAPVGATTSFGQQPPQAGLFTPEHFESTLEQNLVEPAFSQPMTQPAFPHTPTPTADTATHLGGTPATGALGVTQPSFPHTPTPTTATPVSVAPSAPALTNTPMSQDLPASKIAGAPPAGFTPITPDPVGYFFDRMLGGFTSQGIHNPAGYSLGLPAGNPNSQQGQALLDQNARTPTSEGNRGGKTHMVQKKMPDGTYQWVEEPFKKGGKVYRRTVGSQMTDHVISKFGAKLPASNYQPIGSKAGRR